MSLATYKQKRDFTKTPEPKGKVVKKGERPIFVIQEHWATHHHFDLRLEMPARNASRSDAGGEGVLRSWAVPKGVPEDTGVKRLAIAVEDHPFGYANFEGTIPEGLYGAGKVKIWDKGTYDLSEQTEGKLEFVLHGKRLEGAYVMIKLKGRSNHWLLWKR